MMQVIGFIFVSLKKLEHRTVVLLQALPDSKSEVVGELAEQFAIEQERKEKEQKECVVEEGQHLFLTKAANIEAKIQKIEDFLADCEAWTTFRTDQARSDLIRIEDAARQALADDLAAGGLHDLKINEPSWSGYEAPQSEAQLQLGENDPDPEPPTLFVGPGVADDNWFCEARPPDFTRSFGSRLASSSSLSEPYMVENSAYPRGTPSASSLSYAYHREGYGVAAPGRSAVATAPSESGSAYSYHHEETDEFVPELSVREAAIARAPSESSSAYGCHREDTDEGVPEHSAHEVAASRAPSESSSAYGYHHEESDEDVPERSVRNAVTARAPSESSSAYGYHREKTDEGVSEHSAHEVAAAKAPSDSGSAFMYHKEDTSEEMQDPFGHSVDSADTESHRSEETFPRPSTIGYKKHL